MRHSFGKGGVVMLIAASSAIVSGCLMGGESEEASLSGPGPGPAPANSAPTISGNPPPAVTVGSNYTFTPTASDPDGDSLTFSIENRPTWATFDASTGTLSGTATLGAEGTYADIRITVSDGSLSASLPQFSVDVTQIALGSATLSWTAPTQNTDGSPLDDLTAYKIYYGVNQGTYPNQIRIDNPGVTTYVVENLSPNTYFFVTTAVNSIGVESAFSNMASKTVTTN